jgi:diaminohydroxyphosphoribosylaminopyrimidine deaminase/5-amino-6-(5-phosphoribosylamino)uracil reductase
MRRALELAELGWGEVAPNPMVGAVVARAGEVVGEGFHQRWGGPHAEVVALRAAGERARGATLFVTLEPCHHRGKTGPCSHLVAESGIARVVYAVAEVNPEAAGGAAWLRNRGVEVKSGVCETEAETLNAVYFNAFRRERPFLALKYALSLDSRLSEGAGQSTRITGPEAVRKAHRLRAGHDAVMVGIGTALVDDPQLTVREWETPRIKPVRVVLDSDLRLPETSRLVASARETPVWVLAAPYASAQRSARLEGAGVTVVKIPRAADSGGLDLGAVLATLWQREIRSLLCEGGGELGAAWLAGGHVDRFYVFIAPVLVGRSGVPAFPGERGLAARDWQLIGREELGPDTLLVLSPAAAATEQRDV